MISYQTALHLIVVTLTTVHISCTFKWVVIIIIMHPLTVVIIWHNKCKIGSKSVLCCPPLWTIMKQSRKQHHQVNAHMAHYYCQLYHESNQVNAPMHHSTNQAFHDHNKWHNHPRKISLVEKLCYKGQTAIFRLCRNSIASSNSSIHQNECPSTDSTTMHNHRWVWNQFLFSSFTFIIKHTYSYFCKLCIFYHMNWIQPWVTMMSTKMCVLQLQQFKLSINHSMWDMNKYECIVLNCLHIPTNHLNLHNFMTGWVTPDKWWWAYYTKRPQQHTGTGEMENNLSL